MTDNDIIKALECCMYGHGCEDCHYIGKGFCNDKLKRDALDLINRQQAESERLQKAIKVQDIMIEQQDYKIKSAKSEAIKEFAEKIDQLFYRYAHILSHADCARKDYIEADDGTEIEMQSVWDVFTLKKYGIAEYEEMNRLQTNIELIEKGRLLAELKKDLRLLVKELTEGNQ